MVENDDDTDDSEEEFKYGEAIEYVSLGCVIKRDLCIDDNRKSFSS